MCGEAHSHKSCPNKEKEPQNVQTVEDLMSPTTEAVLHTRIKLLGNMSVYKQVLYASILKQASPPPPTTHLISPPNKYSKNTYIRTLNFHGQAAVGSYLMIMISNIRLSGS